MPDENGNPTAEELKNAPPTADVSKGTPHNLNTRLAAMDAETRELVEKAIADKVILARNLEAANKDRAKTEARLAEFLQKEQDAEKARLAEQGHYKELAEKAEAELRQLKAESKRREVRDAVSRELLKAGALDEDLVAEGLLVKYSDELTADNASRLVERLKADKPLLFKAEKAEEEVEESEEEAKAETVVTRSTGQAAQQPQPGASASKFDALDKKHSKDEVERMWKQATKNAFF